MRISAFIFSVIFSGSAFLAMAQSTYIPLGDKQYDVLERLQIKTGLAGLNFADDKPYSRKEVAQQVEMVDSILKTNPNFGKLTDADKNGILNLLMDNSEWSKPRDYYLSKKPVFGANGIYKTKDNLLEVNNPDLFITVNPVVYFAAGKEQADGKLIYQNTRGITVRGLIDQKVGFNIYFTDNQERDASYVMQYVLDNKALPGEGNFKTTVANTKSTLDYFDARGSATWSIAKRVDMQFGFDQNVIGDGYRSLFLSDFSNSATFLKMSTHLWKFNYENILMELYLPHTATGNDIFNRKYARFSDLSINATKWLNAGVFEGMIFDQENNFNAQYLVPVIFFTPFGNAGNNSNALIGLHARANVAKAFQFYGQLAIDKLNTSQTFNGKGWWGNQNGFQLGGKYIDAFGLKNTDLQLEFNEVRPFTYAADDNVANYTHYNLPLAHPLGANFQEIVAILKLHPANKWYITGQIIHYIHGLDSAGVNFGGNIFENYNTRTSDYGFTVGGGDEATCNIINGVVSYELKENMFLELGGIYRTFKLASDASGQKNVTMVNFTFRWNIARRDFNF
jgi:hypothetical protein